MDINASPINPWLLPVAERHPVGSFSGAREGLAEPPARPAPPPSDAPVQPPRQVEAEATDYRQMVQQTRFEQARHAEAIRLDTEPFPVRQALNAYQQQYAEGQRFLGGIELMPRVDDYV